MTKIKWWSPNKIFFVGPTNFGWWVMNFGSYHSKHTSSKQPLSFLAPPKVTLFILPTHKNPPEHNHETIKPRKSDLIIKPSQQRSERRERESMTVRKERRWVIWGLGTTGSRGWELVDGWFGREREARIESDFGEWMRAEWFGRETEARSEREKEMIF